MNLKRISLAIGNGESRKHVDISKIKNTVVGCNGLHRDFEVPHLICVDRRCVREALSSANCKNTNIYTRPEWYSHFKDPRLSVVPNLPYTGNLRQDDPFHWGSGGYAVLLAANLADEIHMLGFDLWGINQKVNNVYKDTPLYDASSKQAVDPRYWIYQIQKLFEIYKDKYFIVYNTSNWQMPDSWKMSNVVYKSIDLFNQE